MLKNIDYELQVMVLYIRNRKDVTLMVNIKNVSIKYVNNLITTGWVGVLKLLQNKNTINDNFRHIKLVE